MPGQDQKQLRRPECGRQGRCFQPTLTTRPLRSFLGPFSSVKEVLSVPERCRIHGAGDTIDRDRHGPNRHEIADVPDAGLRPTVDEGDQPAEAATKAQDGAGAGHPRSAALKHLMSTTTKQTRLTRLATPTTRFARASFMCSPSRAPCMTPRDQPSAATESAVAGILCRLRGRPATAR